MVDRLNARFRRSPFSESWAPDGTLADAGILVHTFDGYEAGQLWLPATNGPGATEQSGCFVFAGQRVAGEPIPVYRGGSSGIIFRPGHTRILCGKAVDSGGHCPTPGDRNRHWCAASRTIVDVPWTEADDKLCAFRPEDFAVQLERLTNYQTANQRLFYNEIIVDAVHWRGHLPDVVESVYGNRAVHDAFVSRFGLSEATHPYLTLDASDWETPFRLG